MPSLNSAPAQQVLGRCYEDTVAAQMPNGTAPDESVLFDATRYLSGLDLETLLRFTESNWRWDPDLDEMAAAAAIEGTVRERRDLADLTAQASARGHGVAVDFVEDDVLTWFAWFRPGLLLEVVVQFSTHLAHLPAQEMVRRLVGVSAMRWPLQAAFRNRPAHLDRPLPPDLEPLLRAALVAAAPACSDRDPMPPLAGLGDYLSAGIAPDRAQVYADCEIPVGEAAWLERPGGQVPSLEVLRTIRALSGA